MAVFNETSPGRFSLLWRFPGWIWLIFTVAGCIMIIAALVGFRNNARLGSEGIETTAVVTDMRKRTKYSDGKRRTTHKLTYEFETRDGAQISDSASVSANTYRQAKIGAEVRVVYWPKDPNLNAISSDNAQQTPWFFGSIGLLFGVFGGVGGARYARKAMTCFYLREHGLKMVATVTGHSKTSYSVNKQKLYRLEWRNGEGRTGQSLAVAPKRLKAFAPGSEITIYVDPNHPDRQVWQGDCGVRKSDTDGAPPSSGSKKNSRTVRRN